MTTGKQLPTVAQMTKRSTVATRFVLVDIERTGTPFREGMAKHTRASVVRQLKTLQTWRCVNHLVGYKWELTPRGWALLHQLDKGRMS